MCELGNAHQAIGSEVCGREAPTLLLPGTGLRSVTVRPPMETVSEKTLLDIAVLERELLA